MGTGCGFRRDRCLAFSPDGVSVGQRRRWVRQDRPRLGPPHGAVSAGRPRSRSFASWLSRQIVAGWCQRTTRNACRWWTSIPRQHPNDSPCRPRRTAGVQPRRGDPGHGRGRNVSPWDTETWVEVTGPQQGWSGTRALAYSPAGGTLAVGAANKLIRLWDWPRGLVSQRIADAGQAGVHYSLRIVRDGVLLREKNLVGSHFSTGDLRLLATCEGSRLTIQGNSQPPLVFEDCSRGGRNRRACWRSVGREASGLRGFRIAHQPVPPTASPLERGDAAYVAGRYSRRWSPSRPRRGSRGWRRSQEARLKRRVPQPTRPPGRRSRRWSNWPPSRAIAGQPWPPASCGVTTWNTTDRMWRLRCSTA